MNSGDRLVPRMRAETADMFQTQRVELMMKASLLTSTYGMGFFGVRTPNSLHVRCSVTPPRNQRSIKVILSNFFFLKKNRCSFLRQFRVNNEKGLVGYSIVWR